MPFYLDAYDKDYPLLPAVAVLSLSVALLTFLISFVVVEPIAYLLTVFPWSVWKLWRLAPRKKGQD